MKKYTLKENIEHIWEYYHRVIIICVCAAVFLVIVIAQMASKDEPDVHMLYVGPAALTARGFENLEDTVAGLIDDFNGDGKKTLSYIALTVNSASSTTTYDPDLQAEMDQSFMTEITAGDCFVFVVDEDYFEKLVTMDLLTPFSSVLSETEIPHAVIDDKGVCLRDIDCAELSGFEDLPRESIVCLRRSPDDSGIKYGRTQEKFEDNLAFFKNIVTYKDKKISGRSTVDMVYVGTRILNKYGLNRLDDAVYKMVKAYKSDIIASASYKSYGNNITYDSEGGLKYDEQIIEEAMTYISESKPSIVIADEVLYKRLCDENMLVKLSELVDVKDGFFDYGAYLRDLPIFEVTGFRFMEDNTLPEKTQIVCLLKQNGDTASYEFNKLFFTKMFKAIEQ